ncbi:MAG TPA: NADPH:quinone reductase [Beijerinckiaceae bacterium]|jgi:NADPH2:quinone reductase
MRAGWYERCGAADEVIAVGEAPTPTAGPGEVLVRLHASGINPSDYKRRANVAAGIEFPRVIPHSDGAGVIAGVGEGVDGHRVGDRVWTFHAQWARPWGTAAEYVALPAALVRPLPAPLGFEQGACLGIPAMTAHRCVFANGPVDGATVYVPAAAGRVGAYAIQFAKRGGARVIASAGSAEKRALARDLGADLALDRDDPQLGDRLLAETGGRGVDRVIEIDFPNNIAFDERVVADGGGIAVYGAPPKPQATLTLSPRRARNLSIEFTFVYTLRPAIVERTCAGVIEAAPHLTHRIAGVIPLDELARAHREAESQSGTGHMIVSIP